MVEIGDDMRAFAEILGELGVELAYTLQFEIGDLDIPDRASQNEIAFAAVDLSAEVLRHARRHPGRR